MDASEPGAGAEVGADGARGADPVAALGVAGLPADAANEKAGFDGSALLLEAVPLSNPLKSGWDCSSGAFCFSSSFDGTRLNGRAFGDVEVFVDGAPKENVVGMASTGSIGAGADGVGG